MLEKIVIGNGNAERQMRNLLTKVKEELNSIETEIQPLNLETLNRSFDIYQNMVDNGNMLLKECDESLRDDFENKINKWKEVLRNKFIKFFKVPSTIYYKVERGKEEFNDMGKVILMNEELLKEKIKEAVNYFGEELLNQKLFCNPMERDSEDNLVELPMTIREILDISITDWQNLIMENGIPIPYYHFLYNNNLPYIIGKIM